jgi:hypothetical protein
MARWWTAALLALAGCGGEAPDPEPARVAALLDRAVLAETDVPAGTTGRGACDRFGDGARLFRCQRQYVSPARTIETVAIYDVVLRDGCVRGELRGGWPELDAGLAETPRVVRGCAR